MDALSSATQGLIQAQGAFASAAAAAVSSFSPNPPYGGADFGSTNSGSGGSSGVSGTTSSNLTGATALAVQTGADPLTAMVGMMAAETAYKTSAAVVRTAAQMDKTLMGIFA